MWEKVWLVVEWKFIKWRPPSPQCNFLYFFPRRPKRWYASSHMFESPRLITNFFPTTAAPHIGWLLCVAVKWRPPKSTMHFLY